MENEKRIKVLASDVGGVMAYFKTGYTSKTLRDFAVALEFHSGCPTEFWETFLTIEPGTFEHDFIAGNISPKVFYWKMRKEAGEFLKMENAPFPSFQLYREMWCNIFIPNFELLDELRWLSKVYKLVLASNIDKWHYYLLRRMCDWSFVAEGGVISWKDHLVKPDKEFFKLLIKNNRVLPSEIFFFDDTPENIKVASDCGITVHLFENNEGLFNAFKENGITHLRKQRLVYLINSGKDEKKV